MEKNSRAFASAVVLMTVSAVLMWADAPLSSFHAFIGAAICWAVSGIPGRES